MKLKIPVDNLHIEVSSICTLKCPRCPRSEIPETLLNKQLNFDFFKNQIGSNKIKELRQILFCGNDGDPIYCKDFLEICEWIKTTNPNINLRIVTNGSYKKKEWWEKLAKITNEHDEITWSLDGWDNKNNNLYRMNSDWDSILEGIVTFFKNNDCTFRVWGIIPFSFNENKLDTIKEYAKDLGFHQFRITKSSKFGNLHREYHDEKLDKDPLMPTNTSLMSNSYSYQVEQIILTNKKRPIDNSIYANRQKNLPLELKKRRCFKGDLGIFINSSGEFFPCCWSGNRYSYNKYWFDLAKSKFNLNSRTLDEIMNDEFWENEFLEFNSDVCKMKCT